MDFWKIPLSGCQTAETPRRAISHGWIVVCRSRRDSRFCEEFGDSRLEPVTVIPDFLSTRKPQALNFDASRLHQPRRIGGASTTHAFASARKLADNVTLFSAELLTGE